MPKAMRPTTSHASRSSWEVVQYVIVLHLTSQPDQPMTVAPQHLREVLEGLRAADTWDRYKHEFVRLREKVATARLLARRYRSRKRDDAILNALGFKNRGRKKRARLSEQDERYIVEFYKDLFVAPHSIRADPERLWASGFQRHVLIGQDTSIPFRPRGGVGRLATSKAGPLTALEAVSAMVEFFPEWFASRDAVIARLERLRAKYNEAFELPSRRRKRSRS